MSDTVPLAAARRAMSGLEYIRGVAAGEIEPAPMTKLLGIRFTEVEPGRCVVTAEPREDFENGLAIAHGGFAAAILDTALGCAVNSVVPAGKAFTTLEMKINYTRAITRRSGLLTCIGTVIHVGSKTATSEARLVDADGKMCAHGTGTFILFRDVTGEEK